ncbi:hypothetical protein GCM10017600_07910 [Streptosporangium carneum]|uniref:Uncharacterized protein n=1 Tax=Streptosporangium carneum TaxID=47481 RepID=A0A9W6HX32_9ACTN|nr:hypothetical protein GCM10017600_07910 [Streptosporangium carneum]
MRFRAALADCAYGDLDDFRAELRRAGLGWVVAVRPRHGVWAYGADAYTPREAAAVLACADPNDPGDWTPMHRRLRDGHTEMWWAAEARLGFWGPDGATRLVVATTDPATLPDKATWYLATNLPGPDNAGNVTVGAPVRWEASPLRHFAPSLGIRRTYTS